jgi:iron complex outermembrane receptor protein
MKEYFPFMIKKFFYFIIICSINNISAQKDSLGPIALEPVTLKVSRISESIEKLPFSISKIEFEQRQDIYQQLSFNEYLLGIPGLFALNANNYSQDLRVSIRGFGARSAFGIRGIKILVDGIPETTPDGQGQIDNLNLSIIKSLEIIRGPSSSLYGNASGGVISISTIEDFNENFIKAGFTFGTYNMQQYQFAVGLKGKRTNYIFHGNRITTEGYRVQSGFENYNFNFKMKHWFTPLSEINLLVNYTDSPLAKDSGGLNLEEVNNDRRQARQRNIDFNTEETIRQFKIGANFTHQVHRIILNSYSFYSFRDFYGLLPFEDGGIVDLERNYAGNASSLTFRHNIANNTNKVQIGYDLAIQKDNRLRFNNLEGNKGDRSFDQKESFSSFGFFIVDHFSSGDFLLSGGIRYDRNHLKAKDKFLTDGDGSDDISLHSLNPSIGLNYSLNNQHHLFANFSTSFETPALSELSANPSGEGGFNIALEPQKARNIEIGYKIKSGSLLAEIVLFHIKTDNDLVPYELEDFPDRTFFRNAGSTKRSGIEFFYSQALLRNINLKASYTYSDFSYDDYETSSGNFNDNKLPGIPKHLATISFDYLNKSGLNARLQSRFVGKLFTNDSNSVSDDNYSVVNLNIGYKIKTDHAIISPFIGINNMFNTKYNDNIRINAFGGRFYEPAPGLNIFGGVRFQI